MNDLKTRAAAEITRFAAEVCFDALAVAHAEAVLSGRRNGNDAREAPSVSKVRDLLTEHDGGSFGVLFDKFADSAVAYCDDRKPCMAGGLREMECKHYTDRGCYAWVNGEDPGRGFRGVTRTQLLGIRDGGHLLVEWSHKYNCGDADNHLESLIYFPPGDDQSPLDAFRAQVRAVSEAEAARARALLGAEED